MLMRVVIAPDSFKGSLSAFEAAEAMRRGVNRACPNAEVDICPLSDGGEGLLSVLVATAGGIARVARVKGPMGDPLEARWVMLAEGRTAVIESAAAIGLGCVPEDRRASLQTTTYGVGELIREAVLAGARTILVGLGGTATTDGGAGMAQALGVAFEGVGTPVMGGQLANVRRIDAERRDPLLAGIELTALTDVDNPLTGRDGAARTYGPQKGASELEVCQLDAALAHLATLTGDAGTHPGDGAAGGLGYGLRVFLGAQLQSGIDFVLDAARFDEKLKGCDLVLTGEGRLDGQSSRGKVIAGVSRRCKAQRVPAVALVGSVGPGAPAILDEGLTAYFSLCDGPMHESDAKERAAPLLETLAYNVVRLQRSRTGP
jgi:glycerate kinase